MVKYSIIIPTLNRAKILDKCLTCIKNIRKSDLDFEVLVVDNGSTDNTIEIIKKYDFVNYLFIKDPGLHNARHHGAKNAKGEILCYIDDDSFVDKNWLVGIEEEFANKDCVIATGPCIPEYEKKPPKWLKYFWINCEYGKYFDKLSLIDFYNKKMLIPTWFVFGCNFIITKKAVFENHGFNPDGMPKEFINHRGDGETALSIKLNEQNILANYNPKIKINHLVSESRITKDYLIKRSFDSGISNSFSNFRHKIGIFSNNFNIKNKSVYKKFILTKKISKILMKIYYKLITFNNEYQSFLIIKKLCDESQINGYNYHQNLLTNDQDIINWASKKNYL
jgi:glycosyltransferase involved in cell wall biosynthesis